MLPGAEANFLFALWLLLCCKLINHFLVLIIIGDMYLDIYSSETGEAALKCVLFIF